MKHQVQQVETLHKYARYIHTLHCYKVSFTLPQVKASGSQSWLGDYNRSDKTTLVFLMKKGSSQDEGRISKTASWEVQKQKKL